LFWWVPGGMVMVDEIMAMREIDMFTTLSDLLTLRDYCVCSLRTDDISSLHSYGTYASQEDDVQGLSRS
jgi:hypothetical protein